MGQIEDALVQVATSFKVGLAEALDLLSQVPPVEVTADASAVTASVSEAVTGADTTAEVTADAGSVTADIDQAVASADTPVEVTADTGTVVADIDQAVAGADATVTPDAVTTGISDQISEAVSSADATVPVEADTSGLAGQVEAAVADLPPAEIQVDADTSGADSALAETAGRARDLGSAGGEAGAGLGTIAPAAALATGELGATREILGQVTPGMAVAAAATFGLVAAGKELFSAALEQDTALARLREQFGPLAEEIEHVHVGGLNEDLEHLSVRTGANVDGLRNFAASFATLGKSAGDSLPHVAEVGQEIQALAVRASVLNPNLGTADEIVQRLSTSLARGGRFLSAYGISLSTAQINAEALRQTGKQTAGELSIYDKIVAGATLATQGLGDALGTDINNGAQKAEVQLRSVKAAFEETLKSAGKPLIQPTIDAFKELEPVLALVAQILGVGLAGALHVVAPLLSTLAAVLGPIAEAAKQIPAPIIEAAAAFLLFNRVGDIMVRAAASVLEFAGVGEAGLAALAEGAIAVTGPIAIVAAGAALAGIAYARWTDDSKKLNAGLAELRAGLHDVNAGVTETVTTFAQAQTTANVSEAALRALGLSAQGVGLLASEGTEGLRKFLDQMVASGQISAQQRDAFLASGQSVDNFNQSVSVGSTNSQKFNQDATDLIGTFERLQTVTNDEAHAALTAAVAHGQLSREEEVAAISAHTLANGHVDWLGVLSDLKPKLEGAKAATDVYGQGVTATDPVVQRAAATQQAFTTALSAAGQAMEANLVRSGQFTQAQVDVANALNTDKNGTVDYKAALNQLSPGLGDVTAASGSLSGGLDTTAGKFQLAQAAAKAFEEQVNELLNPILNADQAEVKWHEATDALTESLAKNGNTIDLNTKAGQANETQLISTTQAGISYIDKLIAEGAATDVVTAKKNEVIARLKDEEAHYPALTPLIESYIGQINAIPVTHPTDTSLPNAPQAVSDAQGVKGAVDSIPFNHDTFVNVQTSGLGGVDQLIGHLADLLGFNGRTVNVHVQASGTAAITQGIFPGGMAGKQVRPFEVFPVNEQIVGPQELFVSANPGRIVSKADALAAIRDAAGSDQPALDTAVLVSALERLIESQRPLTVVGVAQNAEATARAVSSRLGMRATR